MDSVALVAVSAAGIQKVFQSIGMIAEYLLERKVCLRIFYFKLISILKNQQESAHFCKIPKVLYISCYYHIYLMEQSRLILHAILIIFTLK